MFSDEFRENKKASHVDRLSLWRKWMPITLACMGFLILFIAINTWLNARDQANLYKITASTPELLFEKIHPDGCFLKELSYKGETFVVGVSEERSAICWLLENEGDEWRIQDELHWSRTLNTDFGSTPKSARVYASKEATSEIIIVKKHLLKESPRTELGLEPNDSLGTVFDVWVDDRPFSETYYYFAAIDFERRNYKLIAW